MTSNIQQPISRREQRERDTAIYSVIERLDFSTIYENCPIEVLDGYSVNDVETHKYYINLLLVNAGEKRIAEVDIRLLCYANQNIPYLKIPFTYADRLGTLGERLKRGAPEKKKFLLSRKKTKLSPYIEQGEQFGRRVYIDMPESYFKRLRLEVMSVVYGDGTREDIKAVDGVKYKQFVELCDDERFAYQRMNIYNVAEEEHPIRVLPVMTENAWLCCCGQKNIKSDEKCIKCGRDRSWQIKNLNDDGFAATLQSEASEISPYYTHHRKSLRRPTGTGLESPEEIQRKIEEYEKTLEKIATLEREAYKKKKRLIFRIVLFFVICFILIFLIKLFIEIR